MGKDTGVASVQFKNVVKRFGKVVAVEKMDLDIPDGSLVTLLGPSGCGKTTLLRMVAGLEQPSGGDIFIKGKRVNDMPIHKRNLGMIFQNYALFPHKSIYDNVAFGLKYRDVSKGKIREKVIRALEMVRLPGVENRFPAQLSGGQQQRIALARAIVIEPDVLLMDEPLSALDEHLREEMRREIDNIQTMIGVTTIFVTHDQREALSMSDKIVVMKDGRKQQEGGPETVYNEPANHFVADFLGHSNFIEGTVESQQEQRVNVNLDTGQRICADSTRKWNPGERVEVVIRAQKFDIHAEGATVGNDSANVFTGTIRDRSYMGGEVSYFVDSKDLKQLHAISIVKQSPFHRGDKVTLTVAARHCRLLRQSAEAGGQKTP